MLPDETDFTEAVGFHGATTHDKQVTVADTDIPGGGGVISREDVQEGGFAAAARADDSDDFAARRLKIEAAQGDNLKVLRLVNLEKVAADDVDVARAVVIGHCHQYDLSSVLSDAECLTKG